MPTTAPSPHTLDDLNAMDAEHFVAALGGAFENAPWVAREAWSARPFADVDALHAAMFATVKRAPRERQVQFLRGHPELAGKEAQKGTMTVESRHEQASAGLAALLPIELSALKRMNHVYRDRHGFPFIIAVRRNTKHQILDEMRRRLSVDTPTEFDQALAQIALITRDRIDRLVSHDVAQGTAHGV